MDKISVERLCDQAVKREQKPVLSSDQDSEQNAKTVPEGRLKRVFICSPFRATGETEEEKAKSRRYNDWLVRFSCRYAVSNGVIPYAPHLYCPSFLDDDDKGEREVGLFIGKLWMMQCEEVWVIGRKRTEGMKAEIATAKQWHIPIKHYIPARLPEERLLDAIFTPEIRYTEMTLGDSGNCMACDCCNKRVKGADDGTE